MTNRKEARTVLKHLREIVEGHGLALREEWDLSRNILLQTSFMETLAQGSKALDLYLAEGMSEHPPENLKSLAAFCLGNEQEWTVPLSDETSHLMFRFPTVEDHRSIYLGSRMDKELGNLSTWRKWKEIDAAAVTDLFPEPS